MNRTLKRPMFKMGGSAGTGITSGLDKPRQQYSTGTPNPLTQYPTDNFPTLGTREIKQDDSQLNLDLLSLLFPTEKKEDKFVPSKELYKAFEGRNTKPDISQFLINFGLNLASATPRGGILSTAAEAAKKPAQALFAEQAENRAFDRSLKLAGAKLDIAEKSKIAEEARTGKGFKTSKKVYDNDLKKEVFATERDIQTVMSKDNPTEMRFVPIPESNKTKPVKVYDNQTKSTVFVNQSDILNSKFIDDKGQEQLRYIPVPPKDRTVRAYEFDETTGEFKENASFVRESVILANPEKYQPVEGNIAMMLKAENMKIDTANQKIADQQMLAANSVAKIIRRLESDIQEKGAFTGAAGDTVQFITGVSGFVDQFINKDKKADPKLFKTGYNRIEDRVTQLLNDDSINSRLTRFLKAPETTAAKADIINLAYAIAKAREPGGRFSITDIDLALQSIGESSNKFNFLEGLKRVGLFTTTEALDNYVMAYNIADEDIPVKYNALVNNNKYFKGLEVDNDIDPNSLTF